VIESSGVEGDGGFEEEEVCMAFDMFVGGYESVILESNESVKEELGLSTNAGMSWQRVEGVKKGVVGCAHRRRWQK
jgi:hypothetical protein